MNISTKIYLVILILWAMLASILAYPMVYDMIYETEGKKVQLDAGASDGQWEFLKDVAQLIEYADELGYKVTGGELYRTMYQQRHYVAHGLSTTYNSKHLKRRAIDLNLFIDGRYQQSCEAYAVLGEYWESLSPKNKWGGNWHTFKDCPHFQRGD